MASKDTSIKIVIPTTQQNVGVVYYQVEVEVGNKAWTCLKRYSKFEELNNNLIKSELAKKIPTGCGLPPKKWKVMTSHSSPQFIEKRRLNLEIYLQRLLAVAELSSSSCVQDFISSDKVEQKSSTVEEGTTKKESKNRQKTEGPTTSTPFVAKAKSKSVTCTCGLPLCVCKPDEEEKKDELEPSKESKEVDPVVEVKPKPQKKTNYKPGTLFSGFGSTKTTYDFKGNLNEQCRDAIKAGDDDGVKCLLEANADPRYADRTGNTLSHLAAMFNRYEAVKMLVAGGADLWANNPSGETAIDLAPPALVHKMKELQPKPNK